MAPIDAKSHTGRRRILFGVNVGWFFMSHRLPLAIAATNAGYEVHVATALDPELDARTESDLAQCGVILHRMRLSRSGAQPLGLVREFIAFLQLYRRLQPDIVHLVTLKPILLGGMAAKIAGIRNVILAVPGRGSVFSARGIFAACRRWAALVLYHLAYRRRVNRVIVQNVEDKDYFVSRRVFASVDIRLIRGSGVRLDTFVPNPEPAGERVIVLPSRMLKEKGVSDFVSAARLLNQNGLVARFILVGAPDVDNPHSHTEDELERWVAEGAVEWWGPRADMNTVFARCHIVCLPTFYGEGVPKVLIEAAACGRPIVTTDVPGCRDIVRDGHNGILVKPRAVPELAAALGRLTSDRALRTQMGQRGRALVEAEFGLDLVVRQTFEIYREFPS